MPVFKFKIRRQEIERRLVEFTSTIKVEAESAQQAAQAVRALNNQTTDLVTEVEWKRGKYEDLASEVTKQKPKVGEAVLLEDADGDEADYVAEDLIEKYGDGKDLQPNR